MDATEYTELTRRLTDVAMGRHPASLVIQNGQWVCVQSGEIIPGTSIAIYDQRIAYIGADASHTIGPLTEVVDVGGRFLAPGLLDGHMHVESGMLTITEFVRCVIPHGTTGMFIDPHEIANVMGMPGVKLMVDEASVQPIHVWVQMPSCVPSAPGLETPAAILGSQEIHEAMRWQGIIGLGEMMNFPGVYLSDEKMHSHMGETRAAGKVIGGHYASPDLGLPFHGYVSGGAEDDHEGTRKEDAIARARQGMKIMLRYGSAWHDVAEGVKAITEAGLDSRRFILCTDDSHSETLVSEGHVNRAVRQAILNGVPALKAYQMATLNPAEHFGVSKEVGMLAAGRYADVLVFDELETVNPCLVFTRGRLVASNGELSIDIPEYSYPESAKNSVKLARKINRDDFVIHLPTSNLTSLVDSKFRANVIGIIENQAPTRHLQLDVTIHQGRIDADINQDLAKVAVIERHHGSGRIQLGLVSGFGLKLPCGIASTVAHDCHHIVVIGTSDADMAVAANTLAEIGGGQVVVYEGKVIGLVPLPIAGLMSDQHAHTVARQAASVLEGFRYCGCQINNPNMQLSLLALVVIPELRISDLGLVDVTNFKLIPLIETE